MKKLTKKQTKKIKDQIIIDFIDRHMSKFDKLMNKASKELGTMGLGCSIHALSSQIVKHIATNMADYYGTTEKVKDTFQIYLHIHPTILPLPSFMMCRFKVST